MADEAKLDAPGRADSPRNINGTTIPLPPPQSAAARSRLASRQPSLPELAQSRSPRPSPLVRRRSSVLSFSSIEDVTQSFTDDFILPRTNDSRSSEDESGLTNWHSVPLAFAILPAIAGVLFKNGSLFVTDVLLLGLAALFLNWSIRVPWDWYYSAQALRRDVQPAVDANNEGSIIEDAEDDVAIETASSVGGSPRPNSRRHKQAVEETTLPQNTEKREEAAASLRRQETFALAGTFVAPIAAAYLLHYIRSQLSGSSTTLVSDYNLSIFLLAAEIRPTRQVIRLLSHRTLHLQRTVTGVEDPFISAVGQKSMIANLSERISELEMKLAEQSSLPATVSLAQKADVLDLSSEMRKRFEPRLEGLERAVRRYEKRSTTLALVMEQRILGLEKRLQDALSLAAVAAQNSQQRSVVSKMVDAIAAMIMMSLTLAWNIVLLPFTLLDDLYAKAKTLMLGPAPMQTLKRRSAKHDGTSREDTSNSRIMRKVVK